MKVNLERHESKARELASNLAAIYINGGEIPFKKAVDLAFETVKKMAEKYPDQVNKGRWTRSVGKCDPEKGSEVAWDHFGEYFGFKYPDGSGTEVQVALGYDSRHWIWTGEVRIPWRVFLSSIPTSPDLPKHVEDKIQRKYRGEFMRDGFSWVYYQSDFQEHYTFIPIPADKLPSEDDSDYVTKLAEAVFSFLDELFKP